MGFLAGEVFIHKFPNQKEALWPLIPWASALFFPLAIVLSMVLLFKQPGDNDQ